MGGIVEVWPQWLRRQFSQLETLRPNWLHTTAYCCTLNTTATATKSLLPQLYKIERDNINYTRPIRPTHPRPGKSICSGGEKEKVWSKFFSEENLWTILSKFSTLTHLQKIIDQDEILNLNFRSRRLWEAHRPWLQGGDVLHNQVLFHNDRWWRSSLTFSWIQ